MEVFLHIGLMKTGSTFLQRQVIPKLSVRHFSNPKCVEPNPVNVLQPLLCKTFTKATADEAKSKLLSFFNSSEKGVEKTVLSWEGLVGNPQIGYLNQDRVADLIKATFPDAKILITIRRQDNFAESLYIQTIHNYRWGGVNDFLSRVEDKFSHYIYSSWRTNPIISVFDMDWNKIVSLYTNCFGAENVLVLPYELMVENPIGFVEEWCKFIDCAVPADIDWRYENRSYSKVSFFIARILNRFVHQPGSPFGFIVNQPFCDRLRPHIADNRAARFAYGILRRIDLRRILQEYVDRIFWTPARPFDDNLKKAILNVHKKSNQELSTITGMELEKYGYF